ncbi:hypothetical protein ABID82_006576 [Methylobacterium sp. PvP062]|uniref:Uncharacterized protein n=1 Tax=Methylobacterium radiotolerans TaxID=31998 RepID=A0ABV2NTB7_9HYPH|nr:hypothetical protein [Methylobacterium sp. PvP109]MBP2505564.1 hypothetical protein [Methylobacterium sp. PvP109]
MPYILQRLAAGSYDLLLDGEIVGSVVRSVSKGGDVRGWHAELLEDAPPRPAPFMQVAHRFDTLEAAVTWLDGACVEDST